MSTPTALILYSTLKSPVRILTIPASILEFVSAGPKSYAYQIRTKKKVAVKMKGITQTRECCEQINFDSVRGLVEGYLDGMKEAVLETPQHGIRRDKKRISAEKLLISEKDPGGLR